jgi:excisionase family DNA binding protein
MSNRAELLPLATAAKALGMSPPTLRKHIRAGAMPAHRIGSRFRVNVEEALVATRLEQPAAAPTPEQAAKARATRLEAAKQQAIQKLRDAGGIPQCGFCGVPIAGKGLALFDPEDERTKQAHPEEPWFVHQTCYHGSGWAKRRAHQGLRYEPLPLTQLLEALRAGSGQTKTEVKPLAVASEEFL